jgi:hypothetical protein
MAFRQFTVDPAKKKKFLNFILQMPKLLVPEGWLGFALTAWAAAAAAAAVAAVAVEATVANARLRGSRYVLAGLGFALAARLRPLRPRGSRYALAARLRSNTTIKQQSSGRKSCFGSAAAYLPQR